MNTQREGWPEDAVELVDLKFGDKFQVYNQDKSLSSIVWVKLKASSSMSYWPCFELESLHIKDIQYRDWPVKKVGNYFSEKEINKNG